MTTSLHSTLDKSEKQLFLFSQSNETALTIVESERIIVQRN